MAVCRLALLSYRDDCDYGGYDEGDLRDCIAFARWQLSLGIEIGFDGQDWQGFVEWARKKSVVMQQVAVYVEEGLA